MKTMYRTDKYHIKKGHKLYSYCHSLCLSAAILYNRANFLLRQYATAVRDFEQYKPLTENQLTVWQMISDITGSTKYAPKGKWLTYGTLDYVLKSLKDPAYMGLPAQANQQVLKLLLRDYKSFFESLKEYKSHPEKFTGRPKLPKYVKQGSCKTAILTNQICRIVDGRFLKMPGIKTRLNLHKRGSVTLKEVRILYRCHQFEIEVVTESALQGITEADNQIQQRMDQVTADIEEEELKVREDLSREIHKWADVLLDGCERIGKLDITLAKALYARKYRCVMPEITKEHIIEFTDGRHLQVEEIVKKKGGEYCPVSISLSQGVTCITGANMGGKTVSLKLVGMIAILAQYGYFVPAAAARIGLSNFMQILIGDSQSIERGLSSFGSEMEELKEIMDNSRDRSLLLIDEIASGTNPAEGLALTKSITDYLKQQPFISLITTHFETVTEDPDVVNMQVTGLANADFDRLDKELRYANRRERIGIIQKYMDYRLTRVDNNREIPKDALNIAKMLGIDATIIEKAKQYLN